MYCRLITLSTVTLKWTEKLCTKNTSEMIKKKIRNKALQI